MAGRYAVGVDVHANAGVVLKKRSFLDLCKDVPYPEVVKGRIMGRGEGLKWMVQWQLTDEVTYNSEHGARALKLNAAAPPPIPEGGNLEGDSEGMSVGSDEWEDAADVDLEDRELEPVEDPLAGDRTDDSLRPNGLQWMREPDGISDDARRRGGGCDQEPALRWPRGDSSRVGALVSTVGKTFLAYFLFLFPLILDICVVRTNFFLEKAGHAPMGLGELLQVIGILFALGIQCPRVRRDAWGDGEGSIWGSPQFGTKYGISKHRFETILALWCWWPDEMPWNDLADRWRPVRFFQCSFNAHMCKIFEPGWVIVADESTTKWVGLEEWHSDGCPHVTKIPRKPENVAVELRDVACGVSEICIFIEIQEGKAAMAKKEFVCTDMPTGTSFMLRATKAWQGSCRVVLGDSAFASVATAMALRDVGLFFIGLVKTACRFFPKKFLQEEPIAARGDTLTLSAVKDRTELIAHVWNDPGKPDKPRKALIATCGHTGLVDPSCRRRYRNDPETGQTTAYVKEVPRTDIVKTYFSYAGAIDRFNRGRQDGFRLERNVEVKNWENRMLTSLLGYVGTNAFLAAKLEGKATDLNGFMHDLALQLLTNGYEGSKFAAAKKKTEKANLQARDFLGGERPVAGGAGKSPLFREGMVLRHNFASLGSLSSFSERKTPKGVCGICGNPNASVFCVSCTDQAAGKLSVVCGSKGNPCCMSWHCQLDP